MGFTMVLWPFPNSFQPSAGKPTIQPVYIYIYIVKVPGVAFLVLLDFLILIYKQVSKANPSIVCFFGLRLLVKKDQECWGFLVWIIKRVISDREFPQFKRKGIHGVLRT